ncbi:alpha/beta hydrolase [Aspergillus undulatus]|uniref:alpha/beta hydrolase n=1 Tax=Aspergillus undulatus TaxID=1810928 RepID=UPI003CCD6666
MSLPTIILVHGAWHTPANYASFIAALQAQGFSVHCPLLPSCTKSLQPKTSLHDDINAVRELASSLVAAGERLLMVMHSAWLIPILILPTGSGSGPQPGAGGVIHLLYLCAYFLPPATSVWDIVLEAGLDRIFDQYVETADDGSALTFPLDPGLMFFGGDESVPQEEIDEALTTLVRFPRSALTTPVTEGAAFGLPRAVPRTYVATQKDYGVPRAYQDIMMRKAKEQGVNLKTHDFDTCHSVFISREAEIVKLAVEAARDGRNVPMSE